MTYKLKKKLIKFLKGKRLEPVKPPRKKSVSSLSQESETRGRHRARFSLIN